MKSQLDRWIEKSMRDVHNGCTWLLIPSGLVMGLLNEIEHFTGPLLPPEVFRFRGVPVSVEIES